MAGRTGVKKKGEETMKTLKIKPFPFLRGGGYSKERRTSTGKLSSGKISGRRSEAV